MERFKKCNAILMIMLATLFSFNSFAGNSSNGIFESSGDIGNPKLKGLTSFNPKNGEYTMKGAGYNIWFDRDEFQYTWKKIKGDFILQARMKFIGKGVVAHRKIGIMLRDSLTSNSTQLNGVIHGDGLTSLQYRKAPGKQTEEIRTTAIAPTIMQLERKGNQFILSVAVEGQPYVTVETSEVKLNEELYAGLFICSHDTSVMEEAIFDNVRLTIPAKDNFIPYKDYIGSHIEILDIESGKRTIIYSSPKSLQAPNWTPDGKALVYNCEGKLYSLNLKLLKAKEIPTGFAITNNNDHVLSFDGKTQGISDHTQHPSKQSLVYILPSKGGEPEQITKDGPSYLHGFSPDGKYLVYTAGRNKDTDLDIYQYNRETKQEKQLTSVKGLDDGSEYSPDGKYIYFNSTRTGLMQIWRMKADGSDQEQLTFDQANNWFPHLSPDGKWMVFISYGTDIKADDHPFYKRVCIRMMPSGGGESKIIVYLYGGQGSMNVFNWSPDSKKIAFVSNTELKEE
jgi:TolB protein